MSRKIAILAVAIAGATLTGVMAAPHSASAQLRFAQQDPFGDLRQNYSAEEARDARQSGQVNVTAPQAIEIARAQYPGAEYLDLVLRGGGDPQYVVRLRTADGRRVEVVIDARTGAVVRR